MGRKNHRMLLAASRDYCLRRVFWLNAYDRALDPRGPYFRGVPVEAVDPRTVRPDVLGEVSKRAFDGRPQEAKWTFWNPG